MRFFKNIMKTAVGWLQQQVVLEEPPTVIQSITPQVHPQVLSQPRNLVETHLCPRLQLWLKVVSVDLRQVRSWDPDHPANMALTMLWGRHAPLEALQKALVVERFFAGIGKNAKWRLYLAMSRFGLQAHVRHSRPSTCILTSKPQLTLVSQKEKRRRRWLERRKMMGSTAPPPRRPRTRLYRGWPKLPPQSILCGAPPVPRVVA